MIMTDEWLVQKVQKVMRHGPTKPPYRVEASNAAKDLFYVSGAACNALGVHFVSEAEAAAVAVRANEIAGIVPSGTAPTTQQIRTMDEIGAGTRAQTWMQGVINRLIPSITAPEPGDLRLAPPDWSVTTAQMPCNGRESGTKITTLWHRNWPRAMYVLQRDSANFTIATMIEVTAP